jgi:aryl-alcohol dehydrogenase-like predicted oxidoreductase
MSNPTSLPTSLPLQQFGRTTHRSTRVIFGAAALGGMSQFRADATLQFVQSAGINHIDTAAGYGASEDRLRPWLATHRDSVFLATKTGERSGMAARAELERSLQRMGVERVDLIQLHNLVEEDEWTAAFAPDGAVAALSAARDEGLVSYIGVTGHGVRIPGMHLRSLQQFPFDSVLLPFNFTMMARPDYRSDVEDLLALCANQNVAVQTIKSIARGRWSASSSSSTAGSHFSWYEPLEDADAMGRAVHWVLSHPHVFLNSSSDARKLTTITNEASRIIERPSDETMQRDTDQFGITALFDGAGLERI